MKTIKTLLTLSILLIFAGCNQHVSYTGVVLTAGSDSMDIIRKAAFLRPHPRQIAWQMLEFTIFIHFGMNTFTGREWGEKGTPPELFNPAELDAGQWAESARNAGARLIVMVAKHHDGFCLWPSDYTDYSVKASPWKEGRGDVIKEVSEACREQGLGFGVYLSPWDMNSPVYGTDEYNTYFVNQLTELLTKYGKVDEVWFDGACGEGPNGKRQVYDWDRFYSTVRGLQPDAVIAVRGPDVRWVGTETGYGRETEWSVIPVADTSVRWERSEPDLSKESLMFMPPGDMMGKDLGSREKLYDAGALVWYPSEVDVSIRPGWFFHPEENTRVKSPAKLLDIWFSSVGRNSLLLLNVPPDQRGLIHQNDIDAMLGMRNLLDNIFSRDIAREAASLRLSSNSSRRGARRLTDGDNATAWKPAARDMDVWIELEWDNAVQVNTLLLQENFRLGQRVERFSVEALSGEDWQPVAEGTTIGYKRLLRFNTQNTNAIRIRIDEARATPEISTIGLFHYETGW